MYCIVEILKRTKSCVSTEKEKKKGKKRKKEENEVDEGCPNQMKKKKFWNYPEKYRNNIGKRKEKDSEMTDLPEKKKRKIQLTLHHFKYNPVRSGVHADLDNAEPTNDVVVHKQGSVQANLVYTKMEGSENQESTVHSDHDQANLGRDGVCHKEDNVQADRDDTKLEECCSFNLGQGVQTDRDQAMLGGEGVCHRDCSAQADPDETEWLSGGDKHEHQSVHADPDHGPHRVDRNPDKTQFDFELCVHSNLDHTNLLAGNANAHRKMEFVRADRYHTKLEKDGHAQEVTLSERKLSEREENDAVGKSKLKGLLCKKIKNMKMESPNLKGSKTNQTESSKKKRKKRKEEVSDKFYDIRNFFASKTEGVGGEGCVENGKIDKQKEIKIHQIENNKLKKQLNPKIISKVNFFERGKTVEAAKIKKGGGNNFADRKYSRNLENPIEAVVKPKSGKNPEKLKTSVPLILNFFRGDSANEHQKHIIPATSTGKRECYVTCTELKERPGKRNLKPTLISSSSRLQISDTVSEVAEGNPGCEEPQLLSFVCS